MKSGRRERIGSSATSWLSRIDGNSEMNEPCRRHAWQVLAGAARWRLTALLLALAATFAGGCASMNSGGNHLPGSMPPPAASAARFTKTASGPELLEPTVIAPTVVAYQDYRDPLIRVNRAMFAFNDTAYRYLLIPASRRYLRHVPVPVQQSIGNFFFNIRTPIYMVNYMVQLQAEPMVRSLQRFGINSTVGLLGLFDPARDRYGLEREETHFEDTLIQFGAGYGAYLVLPFFGPSDVRNGVSLVVDRLLNPIPYLMDSPASELFQGFDYFQEYAPEADQYEIIRLEAEEPYIFFRNLYLQGIQRDAEY
jgi:phospholipid-binding lipoprotein MlaA